MKPGYKTTEFWITILAQVIGILTTIGAFTPDQADVLAQAVTQIAGIVVMVAGAFGYSLSRGMAKKKEAGFVKLPLLLFMMAFILSISIAGCGGKLVAPAGGELTKADIALDKYYQSLKWYNNTVESLTANIALFPEEQKKSFIQKADPVIRASRTTLSGVKTAIDAQNWAELNAKRSEFKRLKNELLDIVLELAALIE